MSDARTVPSGLRATAIIARLTLKRLVRSSVLWVALILIAAPVVFASTALEEDQLGALGWARTFRFAQLLLILVPPIMLARAVGEEIHNMTFTYLWSRPIPRWSVISGKLLALLPIVLIVLCGALAASFRVAYGDAADTGPLLRSIGAMALAGFAAGALSIGIGSLTTRFGMPVAILALLIIDMPVGQLDFSLQNLSITHHARQIADADRGMADPTGPAIIWLLGIAAVWLAVAVWRINRAEYSTDK